MIVALIASACIARPAVGHGAAAAAAVLRRAGRQRLAAGVGCHLSIQPRAHGGNLDNKELGPGATPYLPVLNAGAGLSRSARRPRRCRVAERRAAVTAVETALEGNGRRHRAQGLRGSTFPARRDADAPRHDGRRTPSLDDAATHGAAPHDRVGRARPRRAPTPARPSCLMSLAADVHVTQLVSRAQGHSRVLLPKSAQPTAATGALR